MELKKGQKVIITTYGNLAIYGTETFEGEILSIGRKYFTVTSEEKPYIKNERFFIDSGLSDQKDYISNYKIYFDEEDYNDQNLSSTVRKQIKEITDKLPYRELIIVLNELNEKYAN